MSDVLYRLGRVAARRPWRVIAAWVIGALAVFAASAAWGREPRDSFGVPGLDSQRAVELMERGRVDQAGVTARVVATPRDGATFDEPGAQRSLERLHTQLAALEHVVAVSDPDGSARSPDGRVALLTVQYPVLETLDAGDLGRLQSVVDGFADDPSLHVEAGGELFFHFATPTGDAAELIGLGAAVLILLAAFGSVVAMGLPIATALVGLGIGAASLGLVGLLVDVPSGASGMASMVGLGVGIDYALFLVSRHREFLLAGSDIPDAAGRALATAGQAVLFAGGTVVIAILGLALCGVPMLAAAGLATSVVVALMVAASLTLLPALLGLAGRRLERFGFGRSASRGAGSARRFGFGRSASRDGVAAAPRRTGARWAAHVCRHPWPYLVGGTLVLLALAAPVLSLRLGFPDDGTQPQSRTERRAYDLVAEGFGPGVNGPLIVAVDLSGTPAGADRQATLDRLAGAVGDDPGIAAVMPPEMARSGDVATIVAIPTTEPQATATYDTVVRLRAAVLPAALEGSGVMAHIGGATANFGDVAERVTQRLPVFVAAVVLMSFVLLMVVFRSILVPLKAALLNLASIGASYGVMVMVFQWGWGKDLIGLESTVPILSLIPMFMFAVLFGLSMDYEVFLLTRVREEYVAGGDNHQAVVAGLSGSARVITSAALIMVAVFSAFVFGHDPMLKMLGLGLATAIALDATLVRMVLVPATMTLLGDRNWWLPSWLGRLLPHLDLDHGPTGAPMPAATGPAAVPADRRSSVGDLPIDRVPAGFDQRGVGPAEWPGAEEPVVGRQR